MEGNKFNCSVMQKRLSYLEFMVDVVVVVDEVALLLLVVKAFWRVVAICGNS